MAGLLAEAKPIREELTCAVVTHMQRGFCVHAPWSELNLRGC